MELKRLIYLVLITVLTCTSYRSAYSQEFKELLRAGVNENNNQIGIEYLTKAINLNPNCAECYRSRAFKKNSEEIADYLGAIEDFKTSIRLSHEYPLIDKVYVGIAFSYQSIGNREQAISYYTKAIGELHDLFVQSQLHLIEPYDNRMCLYFKERGVLKFELEDFRGAVIDFDNAIKFLGKCSFPSDTKLKNLKSFALGSLGRFTEVKQIMEIAIDNFVPKESWNWDTQRFEANYRDKAESMYLLGLALVELGYTEEGCGQLSSSGELGYHQAYETIRDRCK